MFLPQHVAPGQKKKGGDKAANVALYCVLLISQDMHIYLLLKGGISDLHLDLFTIPFLCLPPGEFFFSQDSCGCVWGV